MFCILITAAASTLFSEVAPECIGSYTTLARCDAAIIAVAKSVVPETHARIVFKCVEQGRKS